MMTEQPSPTPGDDLLLLHRWALIGRRTASDIAMVDGAYERIRAALADSATGPLPERTTGRVRVRIPGRGNLMLPDTTWTVAEVVSHYAPGKGTEAEDVPAWTDIDFEPRSATGPLDVEEHWREFVNLVYRLIPDGDVRGPIIGAAARLASQSSGDGDG